MQLSPELLQGLRHHRLRLNFQAAGELDLPGYKGSAWRGLFGITLKRIVCPFRQAECEACLMRKQCIYLQFFETPDDSAGKTSGLGSFRAHPFILVPPLDRRKVIPAGERFDSELILLADQTQNIPYPETPAKYLKENAECVILRTVTPLRVKNKGRYSNELPFGLLFSNLIRRLHQLAGLQADWRDLVHAAQQIETTRSDLRWFEIRRYSRRQETKLGMGGIQGQVSYQGDLAPFAPWLALGEMLHVGSLTSFGLGRFDLNWEA